MSSSVHFISEANPPNPSRHHGYSKEPFPFSSRQQKGKLLFPLFSDREHHPRASTRMQANLWLSRSFYQKEEKHSEHGNVSSK